MNIKIDNSIPHAMHWSSRHGITVIEVMAAMLVALIGVFGVLVLIPFSVQQAQIGLDQDAAALVAQNAIEDLQILGLTSVDDAGQLNFRGSRVLMGAAPNPPLDDDLTPRTPVGALTVGAAQVYGVIPATATGVSPNYWQLPVPGLNVRNPTIFHFDPIAVSRVGFPIAPVDAPIATNVDCFNFGGTVLENPDFLTRNLPRTNERGVELWDRLRIPVVTATNQFLNFNGTDQIMGLQESDRLFRNHDSLVYSSTDLFPADGVAVTETDLPQPVFDVDGAGTVVRRQSNGRISWSAVFVPIKANIVKASSIDPPTVPDQYKVYILVYADRSVIPTDAEAQNLVATVSRLLFVDRLDPVINQTAIGGYHAAVDRIPLVPGTPIVGINRDDWVMLINKRPAAHFDDVDTANRTTPQPTGLALTYDDDLTPGTLPRVVGEEPGYQTQVAFARVRSANGQALYVEGGPFDFYYLDVAGPDFGLDPTPPALAGTAALPDPNYTSETYVVHLRNVVTVYERTISLQPN